MRSLDELPVGWFKRRRLKHEGWELVHVETVDFIATENDERKTSDIYTPAMRTVIANYGGRDKVLIKRFTHAVAPMGPNAFAFRTTFYVLGKAASHVG